MEASSKNHNRVDAGLAPCKRTNNPFPCHSERSEESRSGLISKQGEIPRRLRLSGMTHQEGFSATCRSST